MGWHFARYGGVAYADDPLYCIEPWRSYAASTSGNSVDRDVTLDGSGSTTGSNVWYALPAARREAIGLILLYSNQMWKLLTKPAYEGELPADDLALSVRVTNTRTFTMPETGASTGLVFRVLSLVAAIGCLMMILLQKKLAKRK